MGNRVDKPWGYYEDLFRIRRVVFKRIVVNPDSQLSVQKHRERGEFWYVAEGEGFILYNDLTRDICIGSSIEIPIGITHCIVNNSDKPLVVYEMQYGNCYEDDIVRFSDKYGRENESDLGMGIVNNFDKEN